ncbi:MAG: class I SAM-dependent methyltransferase [Rhizobiaceae bacterium]
MAHIEFLKSLFDLRGKAVADVGAGDGVYSRQLEQEGARVTALEVDPAKIARAKANLPAGITVKLGRAEALPLEDATQDLACMFFSLHHVPIEVQPAAFDEICRVIKPGGRLHIVEPYPDGSMFDVVRLVEDETFVRTNSHKLLGQLGNDDRFDLVANKDYVLTREFPSFDFFVGKIVHPDPDRMAAFGRVADEMERTYDRVIEAADGARVLHQPCAAYHFTVRG